VKIYVQVYSSDKLTLIHSNEPLPLETQISVPATKNKNTRQFTRSREKGKLRDFHSDLSVGNSRAEQDGHNGKPLTQHFQDLPPLSKKVKNPPKKDIPERQ